MKEVDYINISLKHLLLAITNKKLNKKKFYLINLINFKSKTLEI